MIMFRFKLIIFFPLIINLNFLKQLGYDLKKLLIRNNGKYDNLMNLKD